MVSQDEGGQYSPIQCQIYDYIEIACLRHYQLKIILKSNESITGKGITTKIKNKQEFIVIETDNTKKQQIRLDLIKSIQPLDDNAEFGRVLIT